jgi:tRNA nucleotidyltransferase (CCA-adding enzyme)
MASRKVPKKTNGRAKAHAQKARAMGQKAKPIYVPEHALDGICSRVLEKITPTPEEVSSEKKLVSKIIAKMRTIVPREIEIELAGSVAKGTNLRNDWDFDIFLLFPKSYTLKDLEVLGLEWAKKAVRPGKWHIGYAEHPYLNAVVEGRNVDVVPSFKIFSAEEMQSSVDRSQLHTIYVLEHLSAQGRGEVRLLKQFMKALGVYGAELKVGGFSGYLCELLILNCGSFRAVVEEATKWREPIIDIERHHDAKDLRGKFSEPMIVVDPVDRNRNVAAAVSRTTLSKFIVGCQNLLKEPSEAQFFPRRAPGEKEVLRKAIRSRSTEILGISFAAPKAVPDILWPQLRKAASNIAKQLEMSGFKLLGMEFWTDETSRCALLFELEVHALPSVVKVQGPEVHFDTQVGRFVDSHRKSAHKIWVEGSRIVALEKRKFKEASELLRHILGEPRKYGIPENLEKLVRKARIAKGEALLGSVPLEVMHRFLLGDEI